jgi:hypothetical protein
VSLIEPDLQKELAAHYSAVRARLWAGPIPHPTPQLPEPFTRTEEAAAKWREINTRIFGGRITPKSIISVTAAYFGVDISLVTSKRRSAIAVRARRCAMYIIKDLCCTSLNLLGKRFGRDHSTVHHSIRRAEEELIMDPSFAIAVAEITALLMGEKGECEPVVAVEPR